MVSILREQKAAVTLDEEAMKCFPSYFHVAYAHQLASALEDYGFKVWAKRHADWQRWWVFDSFEHIKGFN